MNLPLFSIILPTYNRAYILDETINYVINQKFNNWELIIVDDGSTDNTREIIEPYISEKIRYIYQENLERSVARNNGIKNATGEYICFLDSDDIILENHLLVFSNFIKKNNINDALLFTSCKIKKNDVLKGSKIKKMGDKPMDYFLRNPVIPTRVCLTRKIALEFLFREDALITEDTIYWIEVADKYPVYQILDETVHYNLHDDNSTNITKDGYKKTLRGLNNFKKDKPILFNKISQKTRTNVISELYFGVTKYFIFQNKRVSAIVNIIKSIIISPIHRHNKHRFLILLLLFSTKLEKIKKKLFIA